MMTKTTNITTTKAETLGKNNYKSKSAVSERTNKENSFNNIMDRHIDNSEAERNLKVSYLERTDNSISRVDDRERVQAKNAYDDMDPSRLEQLRQSFQNADKEDINKEPLEESNETDDTGELTALVASMQKLFIQDKSVDEDSDAMKNAFSDIMDEMKTSALSSKDSLGKNTIDKLSALLGNVNSLEGESSENKNKLVDMLTGLMNALKTEGATNSLDNETQKLETARALSEQLLKLLDQMLGKGEFSKDSEKGEDNRSINAMLQLVVNRTNLLMKQGAESQLNAEKKQGMNDKIKDTIDTILSLTNSNSDDELRNGIEELVNSLFSNSSNQKNQSILNDILHKYGLTVAESVNGSSKMDLDEFKARLTNVLMLMAKDVKAGKANASEINGKGNIIDKFAKILEENLEGKDSFSITATKPKTANETNQNNSIKAVGGNSNKSEVKEEKLLNSILGKEDGTTDSKTEKVNNFITQLNNSKDEINAESITEKPVITKGNFSQDIIKTVKYMNLNNLKELTVKIAPKELGDITIKITMTDGNIKASISANTKEAFNLLSNHLGEITSSLGNNEIKIQEANINIYQEDASLMRDNSNKNEDGRSNKNRNSKQSEIADISGTIEGTAENDNNISILV